MHEVREGGAPATPIRVKWVRYKIGPLCNEPILQFKRPQALMVAMPVMNMTAMVRAVNAPWAVIVRSIT